MAQGNVSDRITCPHCQASIKAPPLAPGSMCTCPKCNLPFPIGQSVPRPQPSAPGQPKETARPATGQTASVQSVPARPAPQQSAPVKQPQPARPAATAAPAKAAAPKVEPAPAPAPLPPRPVITVAADDIIGQMLLADAPAAPAAPAKPVQSAAPAPAPARPQAAAPSRPKPKTPPVIDEGPVRAELAMPTAIASVQPAHQQMPPPPKPTPAKVRAPEIPVVCWLCGTRMYARPEQRGTTMRCPDCHSENDVALEQVPAVKKPPLVTLDDDAAFALSEPVTRPGYKPAIEPSGEYLGLADLDTAAPPRPQPKKAPAVPVTEWPAAKPANVVSAAPVARPQPAAPAHDDDDDDGEVIISEPVERIDYKRVVPLPPPDEIDDDDMHSGRFRDDEWGFPSDPHEKEAWKKSPFYYGIFGFLFYPQTLFRLVLYSILLGVDLALILGAVYCSMGITPLLFGALGLSVSASVLGVMILGGSLPCLAAIAQDTANAYDEIGNWPDWNIAEWMIQALSVPFAAFLAGLPGGLVSGGLLAMGPEGLMIAPFPILISELMFFPMVFGSMLAEGSLMPFSPAVFRSMQNRGDGWMMFYGWTILLIIPLASAISLFGLGVQLQIRQVPLGLLVAPFVSVLWVAGMIVYFRLLGRLLWYAQTYRRQRDRPE